MTGENLAGHTAANPFSHKRQTVFQTAKIRPVNRGEYH